jgi:hypothetical protein
MRMALQSSHGICPHVSKYANNSSDRCDAYVELCGGDSLAVLGSNSGCANDLDALVSGAVTASHVVVWAIQQHQHISLCSNVAIS